MAAWSEVAWLNLTKDIRLDAEYYHPEFLAQANVITSLPHRPLSPDLATVSDGNHLTISEKFVPEGVRYLRGQDLDEFFISDTDPIYIPDNEYRKLARSHMQSGDILLGIVGTIGSVGLVTDKFGQLTGNCKLAIIRAKQLEPEYIAAFLACTIGQNEIIRRIRGTVQMGLILPDLREIPVPVLEPSIRKEVCTLVKESFQKRQESKRLSQRAQHLLLSSLRLKSLDLSSRLYYERSYSVAQQSHRLDAEYFQPKHYALQRALEACGRQLTPLGELVEPIRSGFDFREFTADGLPYVRVGDVADGLIHLDTAKRIPISLESIKKNVKLQPGDVLFTRKGTFGNAAVVRPGQEEALISSEIMLLRLTHPGILPDYLATFLNSPLGFEQVERRVHGVAFYSISQTGLAEVAIVQAPSSLQQTIRQLVEAANRDIIQSRRLLEEAKAKVETAVRAGEK